MSVSMLSGFFLPFVLVVLLAASAYFSALETALFSLQDFQIKRLRHKNPGLAGLLESLMADPRRLLSAILLGDALVNLPLMILILFLLREVFAGILPFWVKALLIFGVIFVLCDLLPKTFALTAPYRIATFGAPLFRRIMGALTPVCDLLQRWSERITDLLSPSKARPKQFLSEEELPTLVALSAEEGVLPHTESEMIQEIIKLGDKTAKDCMTPRVDVFAIPDDMENEEAIEQLKIRRYRRVPVYAEQPDNILGVIDVEAFLIDPTEHYTETMSSPSFVPETMKALDLLRSFLTHRQGLAVVVDEFGGTEGVVTLSDIIEEIISDAVPSAEQGLYIESLGEGRFIVNGQARLDDLGEQLGRGIEAAGIDTIGGLVFNRLGYLPKSGETLKIEGLRITLRRVSKKRIEELLIEKEPAAADTRLAGEE
jgi:CBS domain containing-hemolysin-like protein